MRFPTSAGTARLRRDASGSGLLGGVRHPPHRSRRRPGGPRPDVHARPRHRAVRGRRARACAARDRPDARVHHAPTWPAFWRRLTSDSQLRWIGPEKGVIHLSTAAVVNAVWDLWAKVERQAAVEAARRHDAGSARRAASIFGTSPMRSRRRRPSRCCGERARGASGARSGDRARPAIPAYTTSVGWLGYYGGGRARALPRGRCRTAGRTSR